VQGDGENKLIGVEQMNDLFLASKVLVTEMYIWRFENDSNCEFNS
jgi:hypothetical protein